MPIKKETLELLKARRAQLLNGKIFLLEQMSFRPETIPPQQKSLYEGMIGIIDQMIIKSNPRKVVESGDAVQIRFVRTEKQSSVSLEDYEDIVFAYDDTSFPNYFDDTFIMIPDALGVLKLPNAYGLPGRRLNEKIIIENLEFRMGASNTVEETTILHIF